MKCNDITKKQVHDGKKKLKKENLVSAIGSGEKEAVKVLGEWARAFIDDGLGGHPLEITIVTVSINRYKQ